MCLGLGASQEKNKMKQKSESSAGKKAFAYFPASLLVFVIFVH